MYTTIETERLLVRPIDVRDANFFIELVNSEGWLNFIGDRKIHTRSDAENYIQRILDDPNSYYNVFELKDAKKAIGIVTFLKRLEERSPDIGFAILPKFEKKGFAFEASRAYLDRIRSLGKYEDIIAITKPNNQNSINLLQKLGLHYQSKHRKGRETLLYYSTRLS